MEGFELGPWLGLLGRGLWVTVYATILGTILAVLVAFALGLLSLQHHAVPRHLAGRPVVLDRVRHADPAGLQAG